MAWVVLAGCRGEQIDTVYGQRSGPAWASVNGTGVLGEMFEQAGHTVYSWRILSPRLRRRADCIVWFPDDFAPPSEEVCRWLEGWLQSRPGRTLVYVGRDFDAAGWYWEQIGPEARPEQRPEIQRRTSEARTQLVARLKAVSRTQPCDWLRVGRTYRPRMVRSLQGDPEWVDGIDASRLEIELNRPLAPSPRAKVVLESEGDMLVSTEPFDRSRLIVVANGSFLLNLPLVNREHRKLAGQLIDEVGPPAQTVVFLESGSGGPPIYASDPSAAAGSGWSMFHVWPTNWILLHLSVVGILFCFSRFPIFGPPRQPEPEGRSDFGRHIQALGELLERSKDHTYATTRIAHYRQTTRPEAVGHRPGTSGHNGRGHEGSQDGG